MESPVEKQKLTKASTFNSFQELFGNNLIRIDVGTIHRRRDASVFNESLHRKCCWLNTVGEIQRSYRRQTVVPRSGERSYATVLILRFEIPVADVDKTAGNGCRCGHRRRDQMRSSASALASFEIAIAGRCTALARF